VKNIDDTDKRHMITQISMKMMRDIIYSLPDQIVDAIEIVKGLKTQREKFNKVIVCGMGGSGISGEILSALYPGIEILSNKDYNIPRHIKKDALAILISYSGYTEETLNNYKLLSAKGIKIVVISSNGPLLKRKGLVKIKIPQGLPPRGATGYLFAPLPIILHRFSLIKNNPDGELMRLAQFLKRERDGLEEKGKRLAEKFINKLPIIYANSYSFGVVANRWRCQFNENSKILCHTNIIPEMNHNEIVGLGRPKILSPNILLVFLNDPGAHSKNRLRVEIIKEIIKNHRSSTIDIHPNGNGPLQRMFWTIMLGDFISYYLAIKTDIDPMPVSRIDYLKKRLAERR